MAEEATTETPEEAAESAQPPPEVRVLLPSPIGELGLELRGEVATRLVIAPTEEEKASFTPFSELLDSSEFLDELFGRVSEYFAGARRSLELAYDFGPSGLDAFSRRVLKQVARIPYGKTRTYRKLAVAAGRPDAYRQVLATLLANPLPILVPCHRVVTNKSGIGSYLAGSEKKRWLLQMEKAAVKAGDVA